MLDDADATGEVTRWLEAARAGEPQAVDQLLAGVYEELRGMARGLLRREGPGGTIDATALVHELWLKLEAQESIGFQHRSQFFGAAARTMRRILVDHARRRRRKKGEEALPEPELDPLLADLEARSGDLIELEEALQALAQRDPRKAELVNLRFFAGLSMADAADVLGISLRQAERDWTMARAWMRSRLRPE